MKHSKAKPHVEIAPFDTSVWIPYQEGQLTHIFIINHPNINLYEFARQLAAGGGPLIEKVEPFITMITEDEIDQMRSERIDDPDHRQPFVFIEHVQVCYFENEGDFKAFVAPNNAKLS